MKSSTLNSSILAFLILFLVLKFSIILSSDSTEEAHALIKWKTSLQNQLNSSAASPPILPSWALNSTSIVSMCSWSGINCSHDGSVMSISLRNTSLKGTLQEFSFPSFPQLVFLDLSSNELSGSIPPQISELSKLEFLDLSSNQFSGKIPPNIGLLTHLKVLFLSENQLNGSIPGEVGQLSSLRELFLHSNYFQGLIPPSLSNLSNLNKLFLLDNSLSGSIFPNIGHLKSLSELDLSQNQLNGSIPPSVGNLTNLARLYLYNNSLSGSIPPVIGNLKSLIDLQLSKNQLTGYIPHSFSNLTSLNSLILFENKLYGSIPEKIGNINPLQYLSLGQNQLSGYIPPSLGYLSNLKLLSLFNNKLSGFVPQEIENLTLNIADLGINQFTGAFPHNICRGGELNIFLIGNNHFEGPTPTSLRNCTSLVKMELIENNFNGNISEDFGIYPNLTYLALSYNNFHGEISSNWGKSPILGTFMLMANNLTGIIPPEIGTLSQLHELAFTFNHIVGQIPESFWKLNSLNLISLRGNQISGSLPRELGLLTKLQFLDLSSNRFSNSIPSSLENLLQLHYLNLSNNQFHKEIPIALEKLVQISDLDLSHNFLEGEIPSQICNMESLEKLNISHNKLCGIIPSCFETMHGLSSIDISYNELMGPIPNSTTFRDAPIEVLEGNKGLCGDVKGLPYCKTFTTHKQSLRKKWLIAMLSVLGALCVSVVVIIMFLLLRRWKRRPKEQISNHVNNSRLFSVLNFDGTIIYEEIIRVTNNFAPEYCIGKGGQGSVYKAELPSGDIIAVKKFHSPLPSDIANQREFLTEIRALTEIRHRNIVKFYGFCSHIRHSFLIYEYLEQGSLETILGNNAEIEEFGWSQRINVLKGVANALSYMHHDCFPPVVHRDISSKNVLLDSEYEAHVSDFGVAKFLNPDSSNWTEFAGTYGYVAPELAYTMKITEKCDVYSFGVLALEVIKGNHPRDSISTSSSSKMNISLDEMLDTRLLPPSPDFQHKLTSIIEVAFLCVHEIPERRPTMKTVSQLLCK
ncbi:putative Receptor protein kinase [Melia azedarach]|uniref:Receptor protein kinase n=1 Tax=Melia azedarach TaxID=155640 RepID=A0ACC1YJ72_MELAZ|nr:putative Receptor protein kinase [Melia azedarach]